MGSFRVLLGQFAIVATTGAQDGRRPTSKSCAVAYDVIDRHAGHYSCRDQSFEAATYFCTQYLAIAAIMRMH